MHKCQKITHIWHYSVCEWFTGIYILIKSTTMEFVYIMNLPPLLKEEFPDTVLRPLLIEHQSDFLIKVVDKSFPTK